MALTAVLSVLVSSHEDTSTTVWVVALSSESGNLVLVNSVVLQSSQRNLLVLVGVLLWGSVNLLFSLLGTTSKSQDQVQSGFLLNIVVGQGSAVFQLLSSKDQSLLIRRDTYQNRVSKMVHTYR